MQLQIRRTDLLKLSDLELEALELSRQEALDLASGKWDQPRVAVVDRRGVVRSLRPPAGACARGRGRHQVALH